MKPYSPQDKLISLNTYQLASPTKTAAQRWQKFTRHFGFQGFWQSLVHGFVFGSEPRIYRKRDRHGNSYFQVYNPTTGQSRKFNSERELRIWLDERYYE